MASSRAVVVPTGAVSFELFGHLNNAVTVYPRYFDTLVAATAEVVGLRIEL